MAPDRRGLVRAWRWLGRRDRDYAALRRACRTATVMPALFALSDLVIGNPQVATFAAFGSFAMLMLVDFGGALSARLQAQAGLALAGAALVCLGTLADAVRQDLASRGADAAATTVRIIWTGDHLDAARRLQGHLVPAARSAATHAR